MEYTPLGRLIEKSKLCSYCVDVSTCRSMNFNVVKCNRFIDKIEAKKIESKDW